MSRLSHVRRTAHRLRSALEYAAHPLRRMRLRRSLQRTPFPRSVLFICHGNICRSPYAAAAFTRALPFDARSVVQVDSAGFIGPGRPAPEEAVRVASKHGIDLRTHQSKIISGELIHGADLIIVMDAYQRAALQRGFGRNGASIVVLGDADPDAIERRAIQDPIGHKDAVFEASYARIDRCIASVVAAWI